jgi:hypothetical protein
MSEKKETVPCPQCKESNAVIRIVYGKPAQSLMDEAKQGKVLLGGCAVDSKKKYCKSCQLKF